MRLVVCILAITSFRCLHACKAFGVYVRLMDRGAFDDHGIA